MDLPKKLLNRNFLLLWQGQSISRIGEQFFAISMLFYVKHATDSASLVGLMQMLSTLPAILLGPIGGTFADRNSRRKIIIISDLLDGLVVLSLAGFLFFRPDDLTPTLVLLFVVAMIISTVSAFFSPAISASIPDLVPKERVATANSMTQLTTQLALFIGQGIGGILFRLIGAPVLFLINGLSYLFAAFSETFISIPQVIPEKSPHVKDQLKEFKRDTVLGLEYVWKHSGLRLLVLVSAILNFFSVPIIVLLAFYVEDTLKATVDWYGFIVAASGVGMLVGYVVIGAIPMSGKTRGRMMILFIIAESAGYGLLALVRDPVMALILALLDGFMSGVVGINITTLLQIATPGEIRGRVFGLLSTIAGGLTPIAMGLTGVVADLLNQNIPLIYGICGLTMLVISIAVSLKREFREYLSCEPLKDSPLPGDQTAPAPAGVP